MEVLDAPDAPDQGPVGGETTTDAESEGYAADLEAALKEPAESGEENDGGYAGDLRQAFEEQRVAGAEGEVQARAAADWATEHDQLYDGVLQRYGLGREEATARGLTPEAITRRFYDVEALLQQAPAQGLAQLAAAYGQQLPIEGRAQVAAAVLQTLGFQQLDQIGAQERQELENYRQHWAQQQQAYQQQAEAHQAAIAAEIPRAERRIAEFAKSAPHFEQLKPMMAKLLWNHLAHDLASAYKMAAAHAGLPTADEAQRLAVQRARAARTPRTASVHVPAEDDDSDLPTKELLRKVWREQQAGGSSRL